ncbi:zinc metalloproteinase nas-27-like [Crassostrea virginica]
MLKISIFLTVLVAFVATSRIVLDKTRSLGFQSVQQHADDPNPNGPSTSESSEEHETEEIKEEEYKEEEEEAGGEKEEEELEEEIEDDDEIEKVSLLESIDDVTKEFRNIRTNAEESTEEVETFQHAPSLKRSISRLDDMIYRANPELQEMLKRTLEDTDMIDGDIKLDEESAAELVRFYEENPQYLSLNLNGTRGMQQNDLGKRKIEQSSRSKWNLPIKYTIKDSKSRAVIKNAIRIWQEETCIRFQERTSVTPPGIIFRGDSSGCWSYIGKRASAANIINLGNGCQNMGIALHEIGHALGFYHEQARPDRDEYVTILSQNINPDKLRNFLIKPSSKTYSTLYDYGSIMHYRDDAFAKSSGLKTIKAKQPDFERTMGQRTALSFYDVKAMNYYYCQNKCTGGLSSSKCRNGGYKDPNNCNKCKCPEGYYGTSCVAVGPSRPLSTSCGQRYLSALKNYESLRSPGYTCDGYTTEAECSWRIRAPAGKRVRLYFRGTFDIACTKRCLDFVEVRLSRFAATGPRFCCSNRPTKFFTSTGSTMLVLFRTYSGLKKKGFEARYRYV